MGSLGVLLRNFLFRNKGRVEITHVTALTLIAENLSRVPKRIHQVAILFSSNCFRGIRSTFLGGISLPFDLIHRSQSSFKNRLRVPPGKAALLAVVT